MAMMASVSQAKTNDQIFSSYYLYSTYFDSLENNNVES